MDSFSDYIYIIVLGLISLISAVTKNKGKKAEATEPLNSEEEESTPMQSWEELMEQLKEKTAQQTEVEPVQPIVEPVVEPVEKEVLYKEQVQKISEVKHKINKNVTVPTASVKVKKAPTPQKNVWVFDTADDAKRAFVYSEIFNRKY